MLLPLVLRLLTRDNDEHSATLADCVSMFNEERIFIKGLRMLRPSAPQTFTVPQPLYILRVNK